MGEFDRKEPSLVEATGNAVPSSSYNAKKKKKDPPLGHQSGPLKANPANLVVGDSLIRRCMTSILKVDSKFLSGERELRRIFGSKVVKSVQKSRQTGSSGQIPGGRGGSRRRTIIVSPSGRWRRWDGSLSMELLETRDGYHYFKYVQASSYTQAQRAFQAAEATNDLDGIASILLHHPYHLDSLRAMAINFQHCGDLQISADRIAKCVYALECAWLPMFNPLRGNCRLKWSHLSNRLFFWAFFSHMSSIDRCGLHRSALEICKLLLSLDADDPTGAMNCVDYFSLMAGEYAWLERFSMEYRGDLPLWIFPNFSYSLAICRFYVEQQGASSEDGKATSTELLQRAVMLHPKVLTKLASKLKVNLESEAWTRIFGHEYFGEQRRIPSTDHLIDIYVERSHAIWRLPDLQKLLEKCALQVIETLEHDESNPHEGDAWDWAWDLACVRDEAFSSKENMYSHLVVSEFSDPVVIEG